MSIRLKIILVVLPLIIAAVVLAGMTSYFVAASSVTRVATQFLSFKASELEKYADGQYSLLADNGYVGRADMDAAARAAVESFARTILRSPTEAIVALDDKGSIAMRAGASIPSDAEIPALLALASSGSGFSSLKMGGADRVAFRFPFKPFGWLVFVTEEKGAFYGDVQSIFKTTVIILIAASVLAVLLLFLLARYLTKPLEDVSEAMRRIISSSDLSERVPVEYKDEIGQLSHTYTAIIFRDGRLVSIYNFYRSE